MGGVQGVHLHVDMTGAAPSVLPVLTEPDPGVQARLLEELRRVLRVPSRRAVDTAVQGGLVLPELLLRGPGSGPARLHLGPRHTHPGVVAHHLPHVLGIPLVSQRVRLVPLVSQRMTLVSLVSQRVPLEVLELTWIQP